MRAFRFYSSLFLFLAALGLLAQASPVRGELLPPKTPPSWTSLAPGLDYAYVATDSPSLEVHLLRLDLAAPGLSLVVTPGSGGKSKVRGSSVSAFARSYHCLAAVNASPFFPSSTVEGEERSLVGLSISDSRLVSPPRSGFAALVFTKAASGGLRGSVVDQGKLGDLKGIAEAVGGFQAVLMDGQVLGRAGKAEPRTAAGLGPGARFLFILVADGRRSGSQGLTEREVGLWLQALGAVEGLCLDGGGSSAMALGRPGGQVEVVNVPIHNGIPGLERVVGNCLGIRSAP